MSRALAILQRHRTPTTLDLPENLKFETWLEIGAELAMEAVQVGWWIGDWWAFGVNKGWGVRKAIVTAPDWKGPAYKTCKNAASVARAFEERSRRRDLLGFSYHAEVAKLEAPVADRLLDQTITEGWSWKHLRKIANRAKREADAAKNPSPAFEGDEDTLIIHGDISLVNLPPDSIDWIITDPPYEREAIPLFGELARRASEWLKPGGSVLAMSGNMWLPEIIEQLSAHGLTYHWIVAYLLPGGQASQIQPRRVNQFWKPVLWFVKGEYRGSWIGDVARSAPNDDDKRFHDWGQSESGTADLIKRFTVEGETILDPFCGGGVTGAVARQLGRKFIGIDINEEAIATTRRRLANGDQFQERRAS